MNYLNKNQVKSNENPGNLASNSGQADDEHRKLYSMVYPESKSCYKGIQISNLNKTCLPRPELLSAQTDRQTRQCN
jgi:hypothetical protein